MIEDLSGPEPTPERRGHIVVVSVLLVLGLVAAYAAISSPELRGPYATPRPSAAALPMPRFTPAPFASVQPASFGGSRVISGVFVCPPPGTVLSATVFVGGRTLTVDTPTSLQADARCQLIRGPRPIPLPLDRIAH